MMSSGSQVTGESVARIRNTVITHKSYLRHNPTQHPIVRRGTGTAFQLEPQVIYLGSRARIIVQTLAGTARFHNPLTFSVNWVAGNYTLLHSRPVILSLRYIAEVPLRTCDTESKVKLICTVKFLFHHFI